MADKTPAKRASLLAVLIEAGKTIAETNAILEQNGYGVLSDAETDGLKAAKALVADGDAVLAALKADGQAKGPGSMNVAPEKETAAPSDKPVIKVGDFQVQDAKGILKVVGTDKNGAPIVMAAHAANSLCHSAVDFCKTVFGAEWEAAYRKIKWPGGAESLMTEESKTAAYLFAFDTILKLKLSVQIG